MTTKEEKRMEEMAKEKREETMSKELRKSKIEEAIYYFYSALRLGKNLFELRSDALNMFFSILYLYKTNNLVDMMDVDELDSRIFANMTLSEMQITDEKTYNRWLKEGHKNRCLVNTLPEDDPMYKIVSRNMHEFKSFDPIYAFDSKSCLDDLNLRDCDYAEIANIAISITDKHEARLRPESDPIELVQLMASMVNREAKTVYNPFAGLGTFATFLPQCEKFYGCEINEQIYEASLLYFAIVGISSEGLLRDDVLSCNLDLKTDSVVSCPPFGYKIKGENFNLSQYLCKNFTRITSVKGQMIISALPGDTFGEGNAKSIRKELVDNNYIDKVIFLPGNIYAGTSVPSVVMVLQKGLDENHLVSLIDLEAACVADKRGKRIIDNAIAADILSSNDENVIIKISKDDIIANDYSLSFKAYRALIESKNVEMSDGYSIVRISDVLSNIKIHSTNEKEGRFVGITQLSSSWVNYELKVSDIPVTINEKKCKKLEEPALLISRIRTLKPTFCNATKENPICLLDNVMAFNVSPDIDVAYLCYQLSKTIMPYEGSVSVLSMSTFLNSYIQIAPSGVQEQIYAEAKKTEMLAMLKANGYGDEIAKIKQEYIDEVRMRKHDLSHPLEKMQNCVKNMRELVADADNLESLKLDLEKKFDRFMEYYKTASSLLSALSFEDSFAPAEKLDIDAYFKEIDGDHENYKIVYKDSVDEEGNVSEKKYVAISKVDFGRVVENIINNAKTHGFTDKQRKDYCIKISVGIDDNGYYQIDFANNGEAFPKGLDVKRYALKGEKAGGTGGFGIGGYVVASTARHFGGSIQLLTDEATKYVDSRTNELKTEQWSIVRVCLPIMED